MKGDDSDQGRSNERKEDPAGERNGNPKNCPKCTRDYYLHDCPEFKRESSRGARAVCEKQDSASPA